MTEPDSGERWEHAKATFLGTLPKAMNLYNRWSQAEEKWREASAAGFGSRPHTKKEWDDIDRATAEMNKQGEELRQLLWSSICTATVALPINHKRGTNG